MTNPMYRLRVLLLAVLLAVGLSACQQTPPGNGNGNGGNGGDGARWDQAVWDEDVWN